MWLRLRVGDVCVAVCDCECAHTPPSSPHCVLVAMVQLGDTNEYPTARGLIDRR